MRLFRKRDRLPVLIDRGVVTIGAHSDGRPTVRHWGEPTRLTIGRYCSIARDVQIFLGGNHRTDWVTTYPFNTLTDAWPACPGSTPIRRAAATSRSATTSGSPTAP